MIYICSARNRKRKGICDWYHEEAPWAKVIIVQRPFSHLSVGPIIPLRPDEAVDAAVKEYKRWLFNTLLIRPAAKHEFTHILDVLMQEGDIVLQCSCLPTKSCHSLIIRDALLWAEKFGLEGWHDQLRLIKTGNKQNVP